MKAHHSAHDISPCDLDRLISSVVKEVKALLVGLRLSAGIRVHLRMLHDITQALKYYYHYSYHYYYTTLPRFNNIFHR